MCFPSKTQKALYSDESTKQTPPDTKAAEPVATSSTTPNDTSMAPNVAIVIYTLYGHVAKCSFVILMPLISYRFVPLQWPRLKRKASRLPVVAPPSISKFGLHG
jgi:hypothetical protein